MKKKKLLGVSLLIERSAKYQITKDLINKSFEHSDRDLLLKKAKYLKGTDAEGWAIGNFIEKILNKKPQQLNYKKDK